MTLNPASSWYNGAPGAPYKPAADETVVIVDNSSGDPAYAFDDDGGQHNFTGKVAVDGDGSFDGDVDVSGNITTDNATTGAQLPRAGQLTSGLDTIASGTLPDTGAWASGTAKQNPTHGGGERQITVNVAFVTNGTANAATCAIEISPDDSTYTAIGTLTASVAVNTVGAVQLVCPVNLPAEWYIKLTFAQGSVAASVYY